MNTTPFTGKTKTQAGKASGFPAQPTIKKEDKVMGNKTNTTQEEGVMNGITFKVEKMFCLPDAGKLKAFADISVNEVLIIRGVRILEGKKGLFVSMPQEQGKDNKWYDQVVCKSAGIYETLSQTVIEHFQKASQN
jgi:stage V sporulation protein G